MSRESDKHDASASFVERLKREVVRASSSTASTHTMNQDSPKNHSSAAVVAAAAASTHYKARDEVRAYDGFECRTNSDSDSENTDHSEFETDESSAEMAAAAAAGGGGQSVAAASLDPALPLYDFSNDSPAELQPPKTGIDMPMIWPPPLHPCPPPLEPEPLYVRRQNLMPDILAQDAKRAAKTDKMKNRIVYDCIAPSPFEKEKRARRCTPNSLSPWYKASASDVTLVFESRFETGNLRRAIQVYEFEYDLILKPDVNTRGHTQWFYFRVTNMCKHQKYKFNFINLNKSDSLYNHGMRPLIYSDKTAKSKNRGWYRCGEDICYYQNHIKRRKGNFYTATFTVEFPHRNDTCYFAYCYPYTYTDLKQYLTALKADKTRCKRFRRRCLCLTLAGNECDLLTITTFGGDPELIKARKGIVITARVHPGETNASWMMKGVIDYLTGPSLDAKILRDNFVFKVVPMLNPDGVIVGNYRCSLAGCDLNRNYSAPSRKLHPTIHHTKQMIKRFMKERTVILACDLHGHSRKKNVFMYGCGNRHDSSLWLRERVFPRLLFKNANVFSEVDSNFAVQKGKDSTARVVYWKELGLVNSYTMEASFCGASFGRYKNWHFNTLVLEQMGHFFCDTILDYCDPDQSKVERTFQELQEINPFHSSEGSSDASDTESDSDEVTAADRRSKSKSKSKSSVRAGSKAKGGRKSKSTSSSSSSGRRGGRAKSKRGPRKQHLPTLYTSNR